MPFLLDNMAKRDLIRETESKRGGREGEMKAYSAPKCRH